MSQITINTGMLKLFSVTQHYYPQIYIYICNHRNNVKVVMYLIQSDISNLKIENVELILNCHDAHQRKFKIAAINEPHK